MRFVLAAALILSSVSFAQTTPGTAKPKERTTTIIMDDGEDILGRRDAPFGDTITGDSRPGFKSMIRVRSDFNDKIRDSVNDLH